MDISALLCSDGYFLYNKTLAKKLGPGEAIIIGLFCSKYNYYKQRGELVNIEGKDYFYCVRSWIEDETGLKDDRQRAIIQSLQVHKILDVQKIGMPAKNYYCLNFENISQLFETEVVKQDDKSSGNATTSGPEMPPQVVGKTDLSNNKTVIPKGITVSNTQSNKGIVEQSSTSSTQINNESEDNKTSLEDFRKKYITGTTQCRTYTDDVEEVIAFLNKTANKDFKATTEATKKAIIARLKEGYSVTQMKDVIEHRWNLWKGTDMEQYMRPSTLFRPSNFENYVNSLGIKPRARGRGCPDTLSILRVKSGKSFKDLSVEEQEQTLTGRKF